MNPSCLFTRAFDTSVTILETEGQRCHQLFVGNCRWQKNATLQELVALATAHDFFASAFVGRLSGFLQEILLTPVQTCIYCGVLRQLVRRGQFLAVGTFFRVFAGQLEGTVSPPFCLF